MSDHNNQETFLFTSESVGEGHPDKICDQISDCVLDAHLKQDPLAKVACETFAITNTIIVGGEITSKADVDYDTLIRATIKKIGYDDPAKGLDYKTCDIQIKLNQQSPDIAQGVHENRTELEMGAGDQGLMFGYATNESEECMPLTCSLSHKLNEKLSELRRSSPKHSWIRPDSKTQVTIEHAIINGEVIPKRVHTIVISVQHDDGISNEVMRKVLREDVINVVIPPNLLDDNTTYHLQSSGRFVIGGPQGDAGLTGRKIIVDTYGGWGGHGGGAFSGKDSNKVDRSGAYAARWVAKSLVKGGFCKRALVQVSYAIGIAEPLSVYATSFNTSDKYTDMDLTRIIKHNFDLRPGAIMKELQLKRPIFQETSTYGHFGRRVDGFTWEVEKKLELPEKMNGHAE